MSLLTASDVGQESLILNQEPVVKLDSISVRYRVPQERFGTIKEYIIRRFQGRVNQIDFWALKDVSLEIKKGEVFGIIGRNGAGKSTMLKVVSRVLRPTKGRVRIVGRVSPLLELGAAFHHELTGRENIFLNASLLGYSQNQVDERFSNIVEFADIGSFIDAPLRTFSTGMVARLGFAVATAWEPDILVLDEVLAVGDADFQKKCLGKMKDISEGQGRTVLFVSHNMAAVSQLCSKGVMLKNGQIFKQGNINEVVDEYMKKDNIILNSSLEDPSKRAAFSLKNSLYKWKEIKIINSRKKEVCELKYGEPFEIIIKGYAKKECSNVLIGLGIKSKIAGYIFVTHQTYNGLPDKLSKGFSEYKIKIEPNIFAPGNYEIEIAADGTNIKDHIPNSSEITISDVNYLDNLKWNHAIQSGFIYYPFAWSYSKG